MEEQQEVTEAEAKPVAKKPATKSRYVDQEWEVVSEFTGGDTFALLELPVIDQPASAASSPDDVFQEFSAGTRSDKSTRRHGGGKETQEESEEERTARAAAEQSRREAELIARYEEGVLFGRESAEQAAKEALEIKIAELSTTLQALMRSVRTQAEEAFSRIEKEGVELAVRIAKKIVDTTVAVQPEYILEVIRKSIGAVGAATPVRIRVSPQDYEFLKVVGVPPELSETELGVRYTADESIVSGCVVETNYGEVNLELDQMWESLNARLSEVYKE